MNHHESRGKGYLANDFSLIFPVENIFRCRLPQAAAPPVPPWSPSEAAGSASDSSGNRGFDRMIAEVSSASTTQSSPDLGKHGYLLARFKCKAGQFCRKGGLHSHKTLEQKNVLLSGLSLCNILHVICRNHIQPQTK